MQTERKALIFDIKRDCSEDGPGIRTTVFFKGCPLSCVWCHNPEGKNPKPGISFNETACFAADCKRKCYRQCKTGCLKKGKPISVDHSLCSRCDKCFELCEAKAIEPVGRWYSVEELFYEVNIDKSFYDSTGGGVTLSGGEPTMQMEFISSFLQKLKSGGIHTAIETCGFFDYHHFQDMVLPYLDLIFFDLKLIDDDESSLYTGQSNVKILQNFKRLVNDANIPIIPRVPLIPDITATRENLAGIGEFLKKLKVTDCALMPYNPLWHDKLGKLGVKTDYKCKSFMDKGEEKACNDYLLSA